MKSTSFVFLVAQSLAASSHFTSMCASMRVTEAQVRSRGVKGLRDIVFKATRDPQKNIFHRSSVFFSSLFIVYLCVGLYPYRLFLAHAVYFPLSFCICFSPLRRFLRTMCSKRPLVDTLSQSDFPDSGRHCYIGLYTQITYRINTVQNIRLFSHTKRNCIKSRGHHFYLANLLMKKQEEVNQNTYIIENKARS